MSHHVTVEYGGGLGDMFYNLYRHGWHALQTLPSGERAKLQMCVHVPKAMEILGDHPNKARIDVENVAEARNWWGGETNRTRDDWKIWRQELGFVAPDNPHNPDGYKPIFFPTEADRLIIRNLPDRYIVFAPTAGLPGRSFPDDIRRDLLLELLRTGWHVVCLGSRFDRHGRKEPDYPTHPNLIDLIDRVTLAGLPDIVRRSAGVVTCHSAISLLAWGERKPNVLLYPEELQAWKDRDPHAYCWEGCSRPETFTCTFEGGAHNLMLMWLTDKIAQTEPVENWQKPLIAPGTVTALLRRLRESLPLDGNIIECGTYRGGFAAEMAKLAATCGKTVHACDTFDGVPDPSEQDNHHKRGDFGDVTFERIVACWNAAGVARHIVPHRGLFCETFAKWPDMCAWTAYEPSDEEIVEVSKMLANIGPGTVVAMPDTPIKIIPERFCFAFIDADLYQSTLDALKFVYPRMTPGGFLAIDDYGWQDTQGVTLAVQEFMADKPEKLEHVYDFVYGFRKMEVSNA